MDKMGGSMNINERREELLSRICTEQSGTKVTNCILHMNVSILSRPANCTLCTADIVNHLMTAIKVNEWLNQWKDEAEKILRTEKGYFCEKCNQFFELPFYCIHKYSPEAPKL